MKNDWSEHWGSAEWAQAQTTPRGRLEAELIDEIRGSQTAVHQMDEAAHRALGINGTDGRCLDIIDRRGLLSAGQLAIEAGLTTGAVTAVLDRLEGKGLVRRVPDPDDRRRILVEVTERQREEAARLYFPLKAMADPWFEKLSEDEIRLLISFNRVSREVNEKRAAEIRAELEAE
ncbi:MAG TPA: MarR family transcriptional regulator [Solirubrobacterales bacterium]|nr:MarR family transcriptional regulator [Solirubrobacterales bacterium]